MAFAIDEVTKEKIQVDPATDTYTKTETNNLLTNKANVTHSHKKSQITDFAHTHDDRYYTETEIKNLLKDDIVTWEYTITSDIILDGGFKYYERNVPWDGYTPIGVIACSGQLPYVPYISGNTLKMCFINFGFINGSTGSINLKGIKFTVLFKKNH